MAVKAKQIVDIEVRAQTFIASVGAPPAVEFAEHVLNPVALAIEHFVTRDWDVAVRF